MIDDLRKQNFHQNPLPYYLKLNVQNCDLKNQKMFSHIVYTNGR